MVDARRTRNWGARVIAPVAFFAAVTLFVLVVQSSLDKNGGKKATPVTVTQPAASVAGTSGSSAPAPAPPATTAAAQTAPQKEVYRVKSGDTLESIAARFNTTVAALLELNPNIDPLALRPDQKIRVR